MGKPVVEPIPPKLWNETMQFLAAERSGRITWHIDHGIVRKVELTAFIADEKPLDRNSDSRVESR